MNYGEHFKLISVEEKSEPYFDEGKARFAFEQANERIKSSVDAIDKLKDKSYICFGALITIVVGLVAYFIEKASTGKPVDFNSLPVLFPTLFLIVRYFVIAIHLKANLEAIDVHPVGNTFESVFKSYEREKTLVRMLMSESMKIDQVVVKNLEAQGALAENLNKCLKSAIMPPVYALISYAILAALVGLAG